MQQKKMRLFSGVLVLCVGAWAVSGCGDDKDVETEDTGGSTSQPGTTSSGTTSSGTTTPDNPTTSDGTGGTTVIVEMTTTGVETTSTVGDTETTGGNPNSMCDPKAQDCPGDNKCTAYGLMAGDEWNANKCVPVTGEGVAGDACTVEPPDEFSGLDDCAEGFICLNADDQGQNGFCVEFCASDDSCPNTSNGGGLCLPDTNDGYLPICLFTCDPLLQDCPGDQGCYGDISIPFFICFNPDPQGSNGQEGESCAFTNACLGGLSCEAAAVLDGCESERCCTPFCALDEMTCTAPSECVPFFPEPVPGYENVGICALPG